MVGRAKGPCTYDICNGSVGEGRGVGDVPKKKMKKGTLGELYTVDQYQMQTRGRGVEKSKLFADVINGWSQRRPEQV